MWKRSGFVKSFIEICHVIPTYYGYVCIFDYGLLMSHLYFGIYSAFIKDTEMLYDPLLKLKVWVIHRVDWEFRKKTCPDF